MAGKFLVLHNAEYELMNSDDHDVEEWEFERRDPTVRIPVSDIYKLHCYGGLLMTGHAGYVDVYLLSNKIRTFWIPGHRFVQKIVDEATELGIDLSVEPPYSKQVSPALEDLTVTK
jgi:hypothetical protein